jgi:hypothetical protein
MRPGRQTSVVLVGPVWTQSPTLHSLTTALCTLGEIG